MKRLLIVAIAVVFLSACGDDEPGKKDQPERDKVAACVNQDGKPIYTVDQYANVEFIACDLP